MSGFALGRRHVGDGARCLVVGEAGMAHDGSLAAAHAFVDVIAKAGADAVKFQCHIAEAESTTEEPWRVAPIWAQDANRYAYWQRTEFTAEQWSGLRSHADEVRLEFLISPFSVRAMKMLDGLVPAWKLASGELEHEPLLDAMHRSNLPVLVSTGMCTLDEAERALTRFEKKAVLQCTSRYPCPPELVGLGTIADLGIRFGCPAGLSDHSGTTYAGIAAAALGCDVLEVHVRLSEEPYGPDGSSSLTPADLRRLVEGLRFVEQARQKVDKNAIARTLLPTREIFWDKWKRRAGASQSL